MKRFFRRACARADGLRLCAWRTNHFKHATIVCALLSLLSLSPPAKAASAISLAGVDFQQLCRETAHVPLVQAAIHPAYINVWSIQESRNRGRYEEYSFKTQLISVRVEHDISLYHGLIHRTLDLIGESQWKYRDFGPHEDHEHWLIYHTLETYWPGLQRRQGGEPRPAVLAIASEYWKMHAVRYAEIVAKASALAAKSWCARTMPTLEVKAAPASLPPGSRRQAAREGAEPRNVASVSGPPQRMAAAESVNPPTGAQAVTSTTRPSAAAAPAPAQVKPSQSPAVSLTPPPSLPVAERPLPRPAAAAETAMAKPVVHITVGAEARPVLASVALSIDPSSNAPVIRSTWSDQLLLPQGASQPPSAEVH